MQYSPPASPPCYPPSLALDAGSFQNHPIFRRETQFNVMAVAIGITHVLGLKKY